EEWGPWMALEPEAWVVANRLQAMLAALRGEPVRAAQFAARVLELAESSMHYWDRLEAARATAIAALLERESERASISLGAIWEHTVRAGVEDPGAFPVAGDLVEALVELRRPEAADEVIEQLDRLAAEQRHPWGRATLKRSIAAVRLAEGYEDAA